MTDIKHALEDLLAIIYEDDGDYFIKGDAEQIITRARETLAEGGPFELQDYFCTVAGRVINVSSYYVAAKYFLADLRNGQPIRVDVIDENGNKFEVILKE